MKTCPSCHQTLPHEAFYAQPGGKRSSRCKACFMEASRARLKRAKESRLSFTVPTELKKGMERLAKAQHVSLSAWIRAALHHARANDWHVRVEAVVEEKDPQ